MQRASIQELEQHIQRALIRAIDARLWNWGRWWYRDNIAEQDRDTGRHCASITYVAMQFAPHPIKSGYSTPHPLEIDLADAEALHAQLSGLRAYQFAELERFYAKVGGSGTQAQKDIRYRARRKLAWPQCPA